VDDVTEVTQFLPEGPWQAGPSGQVAGKVAYSSGLGRLLGLGGECRGKNCPACDLRGTVANQP
jgi:hypothetical protein